MDGYEATRVVFSRIQSLDPENASKIMGFLLIQDHGEKEMIRLAFGPETLVHSLVLKARKELGLSSPSSTPPSPFTNSSLSPQSSFSSSSRLSFNIPPSLTIPNSSSPWSDLISPSSTPLNPASLPFYGSSGGSELAEEFQLQDQLSFLGDNSNSNLGPTSPDLYYSPHQQQQLDSLSSPTGGGSDMYWGGSGHRRSYSFSDALGCEDPSYGWRPCLYYARGYCKNGSSCRFVHGEVDGCSMAGSPENSSKIEHMEQYHDMHNKSARQQQILAQLMAGSGPASGSSSFPYSPKSMNFLLQQNDNRRAAAAAAALMMGVEMQKFGRCRLDKNDFVNPAARQIYLTFPADSTFREEDVSNYFSIYGPVQDVRIPYQQKRMFGFVTFVYPETVKMILAKGNPHFVCDARVLVKPYKEKGKVPDKFRKQGHVERGDFSPCGTPTGLDSRDPFDLQQTSRTFYGTQDLLWKRKLEEQADLKQAIDLQSRRLMGLQLLDVKNQHHHRALSFPPLHSISTTDLVKDNCSSPVPAVSITAPPEKQRAILSKDCNGSEEDGNSKDSSHGEESLEHNLPDSPFTSPAKGSADYFKNGETDKDASNNSVSSTLIPPGSCDITSFKSFNCQLPRFSTGHAAIGMYGGTGGPTCPVGI